MPAVSDRSAIELRAGLSVQVRGIDQGAREEVWKEIAPHVYGFVGHPARVLDPAAGRGELINNIPASERRAVDSVVYPEHCP
jgi:hypothetical protein